MPTVLLVHSKHTNNIFIYCIGMYWDALDNVLMDALEGVSGVLVIQHLSDVLGYIRMYRDVIADVSQEIVACIS